MKLLIVEDDLPAARSLQRALGENGLAADVAADGIKGLALALSGDYSCLLLDVMLPGRDGFALLRELRAAGVETPAIYLTARDELSDRLKGLEGGGDDYLVKPFALAELLARLRNLLRRDRGSGPRHYVVDDLVVDAVRRRAQRAGQRLELSTQEYTLLELLVRHTGQPVTRSRIMEEVWDLNFEGDANLVDAAVKRLRRKVDDPFPRKLIRTLRGVGYVLEARNESD